MLRVSVADSGVGIHPDDMGRIFDRFYQSEKGENTEQGGTGIGLALARELSRLFGGDIEVDSQLGKGSVFTLEIPVRRASDGRTQKIDIPTSPDKQKSKEDDARYTPILLDGRQARILIVEDNFEMYQYLSDILSPYYLCFHAKDGLEALKMVQKQTFDLITSDIMMPRMDGFKFREQVNKMPRMMMTPFVLLTARTLSEDKLRGLHLGVDDYITKPFNAKELLARIGNLLTNKLERENWMRENGEEQTTENGGDNADVRLLKKAEQIVLENLGRPDFRVKDMAQALHFGERNLRRIIRKLTGLSPVNFVLEIRLLKAHKLLQERQYLSVSEVRYVVGIESASYFTSKFKERFGRSPSEVLQAAI